MPKNLTTEEFIVKAKEIHGDTYDYSKVDYIKAKLKVIIICKEHGDFLQTADNHLCGNGCKKCSGTYSPTTTEFIEKAKQIHGKKYDYSKVNYIKANKKVFIICKEHGEFLQTPNGHLCGSGCITCSGKYKSTTEEFIEKAKLKHGDTYDYSKVEYTKAINTINIICKEHGDFLQQPNKHLQGQGCPKCGIIIRGNKSRSSTDEFIEKAKQKHGDKYDYSKVNYETAIKKVIIICKIHGEFLQTPNDHLNLYGCIKCSNTYKYTTEEWIEKSNYIHDNKYDYSKVDYINSKTNIKIICKEHGEFEQTPYSHINSVGCPKCGIIICANKRRKILDDFINQAKQIHGDKYEYLQIEYINDRTKVLIICKTHGEFLQQPGNHLSGNGCPKCSHKAYSQKSIKYLDFISKLHNIQIQHAENETEFVIPTTKYKADGYCQETNTIYEFHGDYWHGNPKLFKENSINKTTNKSFGELYQNTLQREQLIKDLGYNLVVMWEYDWNKINNSIKTLQQKFRNSKQN
jgi:hypothetical protein